MTRRREDGTIGDTEGEYSVAVFYPNDTHEYVRRYVDSKEAVETAFSYARGPAAQAGMVTRVIVTDGGDFTNFEWTRGEGITYPPEAKGKR